MRVRIPVAIGIVFKLVILRFDAQHELRWRAQKELLFAQFIKRKSDVFGVAVDGIAADEPAFFGPYSDGTSLFPIAIEDLGIKPRTAPALQLERSQLRIIRTALGILFSMLAVAIIQAVTEVPFEAAYTWNTFITIGIISVLVGIVFGTYPAVKASRLDPVEAIRRE